MKYFSLLVLILLAVNGKADTEGLLYPRESKTREVKSLDGLWQFVKSNIKDPDEGVRDKWYERELSENKETITMPVPASYNDIIETAEMRDHVGTVWYERKFYIPSSWSLRKRVWIRFGSVHYRASVWINGHLATTHSIGHLPFEADITDFANFGQENRVTVLCDNTLTSTTIPQGNVVERANDDGTAIIQTYSFDFFNYAGIQRSVYLFTTPNVYIKDLLITTDIVNTNTGRVHFEIEHSGSTEPLHALIHIKDKQGNFVADLTTGTDISGFTHINNAILWWPYLMDPNPGYLYTFEITLRTQDETIIDVYSTKFGIRNITWDNKKLYINGKPIYFRGFGKHEDSDFRGKGLDYPLLTKDFNLIKWIGANAYRTSHYPYSEESMEFADEFGIMIIDECSSVNTENFSPALLDAHKSSLEQLIHRDRNHPSVVMWSIANEPRSGNNGAGNHFRQVAELTKSLDKTRPITLATWTNPNNDQSAEYVDIIGFNRYNSWYENTGNLNMVVNKIVDEAVGWHEKFDKPVIMYEYGAETVEGLHILPSFIWSEEYQRDFMSRHFEAFDILREREFFIGEFIVNFADFKTDQDFNCVGGSKKGVFTRQRQPKESAHHLRRRYFSLAAKIDNATPLPDDLDAYFIENNKENINGFL